jgi:hypothetical protein
MKRIDESIAQKMIPQCVEIIEANKRMEKGYLIMQMSKFNPKSAMDDVWSAL